MESSHEQDNKPDVPLRTPEERHLDALVDGAGFTVHDAEITLSGDDPDRPVYRDLRAAQAARAKQPHRSRRGGHSYNEGSDSEFDPNWNPEREDLSPEQLAANRVAAKILREMLRTQDDKKHKDDDPKTIDRDAAIRRARDGQRDGQ
jgi:hypothetical protein